MRDHHSPARDLKQTHTTKRHHPFQSRAGAELKGQLLYLEVLDTFLKHCPMTELGVGI